MQTGSGKNHKNGGTVISQDTYKICVFTSARHTSARCKYADAVAPPEVNTAGPTRPPAKPVAIYQIFTNPRFPSLNTVIVFCVQASKKALS